MCRLKGFFSNIVKKVDLELLQMPSEINAISFAFKILNYGRKSFLYSLDIYTHDAITLFQFMRFLCEASVQKRIP